MNRFASLIAVLFALTFFTTTNAEAATALVSAPLPAGNEGFMCGCLNLSEQPIYLEIAILQSGNASSVRGPALAPGDLKYITAEWTDTMGFCRVTRYNEDFSAVRTVTTKQVSCTFSSLDTVSSSTPKVQVPVEIKRKAQFQH